MSKAEDLERNALIALADQSPRDQSAIRLTVRMMAMVMYPQGSEDLDALVEEIARRIEVKLEITMDDALVIQGEDVFEPWLEARRAGVEFAYWNRYRLYLSKSLPPRVIGTIDKDTDRIVGLLADPSRQGAWQRRGMGVGDVQSGKTGNYIGVACKAADLGYQFIVLLAGMQNNLRRQTQERIEYGFIGLDSEPPKGKGKGKAWVGVGVIDQRPSPISLTTKSQDFKEAIASAAGISFDSVKAPIILTVKKQKRVLENLISWLRSNNHATGGKIRGVPMLLLDDEADNASINTRTEDDPTQINKLIRELLTQFEQNCYLGYTATPFANIFIDPDTQDEMLGNDLFPRDFIVSLDAPGNYVGPRRVFLGDEGETDLLRDVEDYQDAFPERHRIDHTVDHLPASLLQAVRCFVVTRTIRLIRGGSPLHNSMMINVSRFNSVQRQVASLVTDYLTTIRNAVQAHAALPIAQALADNTIRSLYDTWKGEYSQAHPSWAEVQARLNESVGPIVVRTINLGSSDKLDYEDRKKEGLNVIAVGGMSLSRGLTLDGLSVSYFVRNSIMYDTLLQMGRWFGYRDGYEDLCRLFITPAAAGWYRHISAASLELREEIRRMERESKTPKNFGLMVRAHPDSLIVTARNKMRTGTTIVKEVSLSGHLVETAFLRREAITANRDALQRMVRRLEDANPSGPQPTKEGVVWSGVGAEEIKNFIRAWQNHERNLSAQAAPLVKYIEEHQTGILESWDVCLYSPNSGIKSVDIGTQSIRPAHRKAPVDPADNSLQVSGRAGRVASRGNEIAGLSEEEVHAARLAFDHDPGKAKNFSDKYYREVRQRPLLMLHVLQVDSEGSWVPAWGISFPARLPAGDMVEYVVNTTWVREQAGQEVDDDALEVVADES